MTYCDHPSALKLELCRDDSPRIDMPELISALSYALDLTEGAVPGHALRTCVLGMRIAERAGLSQTQSSELYYALLLKDIGLTNNAAHMSEIVGADEHGPASRFARADGIVRSGWAAPQITKLEMPNFVGSASRTEDPFERMARIARIGDSAPASTAGLAIMPCDRGAGIIAKIGLSDSTADAVRSIDEHWDGTGYPGRFRGDRIPILARIAAVAQHLDVFASETGPDNAIAVLWARSGKWFDPELVKIAASLHRTRILWKDCLDILPEAETRAAVLALEPRSDLQLGPDRIDRVCEAFSDVVDAKSPFTVVHSLGVADAAMLISQTMGLSQKRTQFVRRAALLHDLGKLCVPTAVLEKRGKLTLEEFLLVKEHPALTRKILGRIPAFRELAMVAGSHHEKLDGSGYPNHLNAAQLSLETRIVAVADVYAALSEQRPYRESLDLGQISAIMAKDIPTKLDPEVLEALMSSLRMNRATA